MGNYKFKMRVFLDVLFALTFLAMTIMLAWINSWFTFLWAALLMMDLVSDFMRYAHVELVTNITVHDGRKK